MEDYYDIEAILADQQRIPCVLLVDTPGLGMGDGDHHSAAGSNGGGNVIPAQTKLELPYWLAEAMAANDLCELQMPKPFGSRMRRTLQASCYNVNFHSLCPYFYQFGLKLAAALDEPQLNELLADVYRQRLALILDAAQRADSQNMAEFVIQLDESERQVYKVAKRGTHAVREWQRGQLNRLQMAEVLKPFRER
ncbi:DNA replication protein [Tieghemiomyces parasiticus]|uniref:DNA replication complex GINS protein PSF3 n=1 Tax=Tieghemiomyces parasiticus TaxID=78921 RepID=A0A9W8ADE6_9FUNG|nr:DNA replication protein [Tieghemiomyces parasiticus]